MKRPYQLIDDLTLFVEGRIQAEQACRQTKTAAEILKRLNGQPGLILADEVGMGKTYVALAVAASTHFRDKGRRPVVIMIPPTLREKWPKDFGTFKEHCLPEHLREKFKCTVAERGVQFLKLLDDPVENRHSVIFLTHGALSRAVRDKWVKLAIIQRAMAGKRNKAGIKDAVARCVRDLVKSSRGDNIPQDVWALLLKSSPSKWERILEKHNLSKGYKRERENKDDLFPRGAVEAIQGIDCGEVWEALQEVPKRKGSLYKKRIRELNVKLSKPLRAIWNQCLMEITPNLPLLIFDEAHHLKNASTRLAKLFESPEAEADFNSPLNARFERMLFLTATPFQLGHSELCSVMRRFGNVRWSGTRRPVDYTSESYRKCVESLEWQLDRTQLKSLQFERAWAKLTPEHLPGPPSEAASFTWLDDRHPVNNPVFEEVRLRFRDCIDQSKKAEKLLAPWVIRHLRKRFFENSKTPKRQRFAGDAIHTGNMDDGSGIEVGQDAALPFLLASRIVARTPAKRPVFAEGLASSYEAFRETRSGGDRHLDGENEDLDVSCERTKWYMGQINLLIPAKNRSSSAAHPKIQATVNRAVDLWKKREKVLIFCHWKQTGKALREHISDAITKEICSSWAGTFGNDRKVVFNQLKRLGDRFLDKEAPARKAAQDIISHQLRMHENLAEHEDEIIDTFIRFMRMPAFLTRYFPKQAGAYGDNSVVEAFKKRDRSGLSLKDLLDRFLDFLSQRDSELASTLEALTKASPRMITVKATSRENETTKILQAVQLVNGDTDKSTRGRSMVGFNTPFFPDILISSSVLSEGVDLHLACRHVIHHDLSWNPATLEQRTGRIDRIGGKVERVRQPIQVYLPYIAATQDEKQYRVVMDRESWFNVLMGDEFKLDFSTIETRAERLKLPDSIVSRLRFNLDV